MNIVDEDGMCCSRWSLRTAWSAEIKVTCLYVGNSHSKFITRITSVITHLASSTATESFWAWTPRDNVFAKDFYDFQNLRKIEFSEKSNFPKNRILRRTGFSKKRISEKSILKSKKIDPLKTFLNQFRFPITVQICIFRIVIEFDQILNEFWNFLWCHSLSRFLKPSETTFLHRFVRWRPCSWRHSDFRQGCR